MHKTTWIYPALAGLLACLAGSATAQCNSVPIAVNDQVDYFGRPISVEPMLNDREPDGEALRLTVTGHNCGTATSPISISVDNGTVRLLPLTWGVAAVCTINYRIEDERGFTANAQIFVQLNPLFLDGFETANASRWQVVTSGGGVEP